MTALFSDGRFIDIILAALALEAAAVALLRLTRGGGPPLPGFFCTLLAGGFLLVALRASLEGAAPVWTGLALLAAGAAHLADVMSRWEKGAPVPPRPGVLVPVRRPVSKAKASQEGQDNV